jgi:hypothetical protein
MIDVRRGEALSVVFGALLTLLPRLNRFTCLQPFVDADHPVQTYFPERKWAIMIPTTLFILVLAVTGTFVGLVMIKSGKKRS